MRKFLRFFLTLIVLIVAALVLIPILFKDQIFELVRKESNNAIKGEVVIEDMSLSLFSYFPNLTLGLQNVKVKGEGTFEGINLVDVEDVYVEIDLFSAFSGTNLEIESIQLKKADLYVLVMPDGEANYDIAKESEDQPEEEASVESANYTLKLKDFSLNDCSIIYDNRSAGMFAKVEGVDHDLSGDFSADVVDMRTSTQIEALTVSSGSVDYLRTVMVDADVNMRYDSQQGIVTLSDNELHINGLSLAADGSVTMGDAMELDLNFSAPYTEFKEVLSLIPEFYMNDFDDIKTSGSFALKGFVKGTMDESESLPSLALDLSISNASFQYPDLPAGADNMNVEVHIKKPQGIADLTTIDIPKFNGNLAGQPVNARLSVVNPTTDPKIDLEAKTDLDLNKVAQMMPQEDLSYGGRVVTDLILKGKLSDFEAQNASKITAEGTVQLSKFQAKTSSFGLPFELDTMDMAWSPRTVRVSTIQGNLGKSNFEGRGSLDNLLSYLITDTTLIGRFVMTSTLFDLDELAAAAPAAETPLAEESETDITAVRIPDNLDIDFDAQVDKVVYDGMELEDVRGRLMLLNGTAYLEQFKMDALGGRIAMNGSYDSKPERPEVLFNVNLQSISFSQAFANLDMLKAYAPLAQSAVGNLNTEFSLNALLDNDMTPILSSITSRGLLNTMGVKVEPDVLNQVASRLNNDRYRSLQLGNTKMGYTIEQGRLSIQPLDMKIGGQNATVRGSAGLDQSMNFEILTKAPISAIKVPDEVKQLGISGDIDVKIKLGGTFTEPTIGLDFGDVTTDIQNQVQSVIQNEINNQVIQLNNQANQERDRLLAQARAEAQKIKDEAKVQADRIRAEAQRLAQITRDEANRQANRLIQEAGSNPIAKAAAERAAREVRAEGDRKANQIISEAEKRAKQVEDTAAQRADQLIKEAEENSQINN